MKRTIFLFFITLCSCMSVFAQKLDISILSFELDPFATTAQADSRYAERDKGGELYAIIKVKDDEGDDVPDGFSFDFGAVKTLKQELHDGELWVWVQRNAKTVTIYHPDYRTIEKYDLGQTIQPGKTYNMRVTMSRVVKVVQPSVRKQVLQFEVAPANEHALVRVKSATDADYELWGEVDNQGRIDRYIPFGAYDYRIVAKDYDESVGRVTLSDANTTHVEKVKLTPNFGLLEVAAQQGMEGAEIFVNDEKIGTTPFRDASHHWAPGQYRIEVVRGELYRPYSSTFTISKGETTRVTPILDPDFANITLSATAGAQIAIDGKSMGSGSWSGPLKTGQHIVTCSLANHRDASQTINVMAGHDERIELVAPTPITGSLYVRSTPSGATITIDGCESGTTPKAFPELLIGRHTVELSLEGYASEKHEVTIAENDEQELEVAVCTPIQRGQTTVEIGSSAKVVDLGIVDSFSNLYIETNSHEWVDLGLPSGTLWATCNVGASQPEDCGDYFAWGETKPKREYGRFSYFDTKNGGKTYKKYRRLFGKKILDPIDDAATVNWGSEWCMPSIQQLKELLRECTWTRKVQRGMLIGYVVTSNTNGRSLFFPDARNGSFWLNSLRSRSSSWANCLYFNSQRVISHSGFRCFGLPVRPVRVSASE